MEYEYNLRNTRVEQKDRSNIRDTQVPKIELGDRNGVKVREYGSNHLRRITPPIVYLKPYSLRTEVTV